MATEKITKGSEAYNVWKVSDKAGFYLAGDIEAEDAQIQKLIEDMTAICGALSVKKEETLDIENVRQESDEKLPYLMRKGTGEKIMINKDIFKLGKDAAYVDYFVDNNPTISRNHADIVRKKDGYYAKDKGSLNHTFVDGKKLEPEKLVKLTSGSLLQLSDEVFEFIEESTLP